MGDVQLIVITGHNALGHFPSLLNRAGFPRARSRGAPRIIASPFTEEHKPLERRAVRVAEQNSLIICLKRCEVQFEMTKMWCGPRPKVRFPTIAWPLSSTAAAVVDSVDLYDVPERPFGRS
jgi:hypothetical protein